MNICILLGSPRKNGNTNELATLFAARLEELGHTCNSIDLHEMELNPCIACRKCQNDWVDFNCIFKDDLYPIFSQVMKSDVIVLATPIYSWYCTPPMKIVLDRLVYGMNKYYGEEKGPALWEGKFLALITTCGYKPQSGADLWEEGVRRYCKHSKLKYTSMLVERYLGYKSVFMDEDKKLHTRQFADNLINQVQSRSETDND